MHEKIQLVKCQAYMHMHVCVCVCVCVSIWLYVHVRAFIPNRMCFQTTLSLAAVEWETKSKPYCAAVCRTAIRLKTWAGTHTHTHTHTVGDKSFPLAPPNNLSHTPHTVLRVLPSSGISHQSSFYDPSLVLPVCIKTFKLVLKCSPTSQHPAWLLTVT